MCSRAESTVPDGAPRWQVRCLSMGAPAVPARRYAGRMPETIALLRPPGGLLTPGDVARLSEYTLRTGARLSIGPRSTVSLIGPEPGQEQPLPEFAAPLWDPHNPGWDVVCSPLTVRMGGVRDVRPLAVRVAERLSRVPLSLSGRRAPLIAVDDGRLDVAGGGVAGGGAALELIASDEGGYALRVSGESTGMRVPHRMAERACMTAAKLWGEGADTAAIVDGITVGADPDAGNGRGDSGGRRHPTDPSGGPPAGGSGQADDERAPSLARSTVHIGWIAHDVDDRVTLGAVVDNGELEGGRLQFVAAIGCPVIVGPERQLLLCDLDEWTAEQVVRVLAPMGFVFDADSPAVSGPDSPGA